MAERIAVVYKQSQLQVVSAATRRLTAAQRRLLHRRLQPSHEAHQRTLEHVVRALRRAGLPHLMLGRSGLAAMPAASLVVTVGGDGTFLRAAHFLRATPILGVNSDPRHSRGAFCSCDGETFAATLERWRHGRWPVVPLHRLAVEINGRRVREPVLNDLLLTHGNPAATARYVLQAGRRMEEQLSSGLWVATAAGSTGAAMSAGGRVLPLRSRRIQFVVREPYPKQRVRYRLTKGLLPPGAMLSVTALVPGMAIYLDGPSVRYPLAFGDRCVVRDARLPLQAVGVRRR